MNYENAVFAVNYVHYTLVTVTMFEKVMKDA